MNIEETGKEAALLRWCVSSTFVYEIDLVSSGSYWTLHQYVTRITVLLHFWHASSAL